MIDFLIFLIFMIFSGFVIGLFIVAKTRIEMMASKQKIKDSATLEMASDLDSQNKAIEYYQSLDLTKGPITVEVPRHVHPYIETICDRESWPCYHVSRAEGRNWYSFANTYAELHEYEIDR